MFPYAPTQVGGTFGDAYKGQARFWKNINTNPTQIPAGSVVCIDVGQRAAYTDSNGTTRSSNAGAPNYVDTNVDVVQNVAQNVTLADSSQSIIVAGVYVGTSTLAAGSSGLFAFSGRVNNVRAVGHNDDSATGAAISVGTKLTVCRNSTSATSTDPNFLGRLRVAASGEAVVGVALTALGSGTSGTISVLFNGSVGFVGKA